MPPNKTGKPNRSYPKCPATQRPINPIQGCKKAYDAAAKIITSKTKADYDKILKEVLERNNVPLRK